MSNEQEQLNTLNEVIDENAAGDAEKPVIVDLEQTGGEAPVADAKALKAAAAAEAKASKIEAARLAKEAKEAAKAEKVEAARQVKAAKEAEKAAAIAAKAESTKKVPTVFQNGVRQPKPDTNCGKVWGLCSLLSNKKGSMITCKELVAAPETVEKNLHINTITSEYYMWKKFWGLTNTEKAIDAPAEPAPEIVEESAA